MSNLRLLIERLLRQFLRGFRIASRQSPLRVQQEMLVPAASQCSSSAPLARTNLRCPLHFFADVNQAHQARIGIAHARRIFFELDHAS